VGGGREQICLLDQEERRGSLCEREKSELSEKKEEEAEEGREGESV